MGSKSRTPHPRDTNRAPTDPAASAERQGPQPREEPNRSERDSRRERGQSPQRPGPRDPAVNPPSPRGGDRDREGASSDEEQSRRPGAAGDAPMKARARKSRGEARVA
jgi:hypothetical protein